MPALTAKETTKTDRLHRRAMLVKIETKVWGNTIALPKELIAQWAEEHGISVEDSKKYHKLSQHKIDPNHLEKVIQSRNALRQRHVELTSPWEDDGYRIVSVNGYDKYKREMRELMDTHRANVKEFCEDVYPKAKREAKEALNGLAKYIDYPEDNAMQYQFGCGIKRRELPRSADFRCDLDADDIKDIIRENTAIDAQLLTEAHKHAYREATSLIKNMVTRLSNYVKITFKDPKTGKEKTRVENKFHDTLVGNLEEFLSRLPGLNFTEDPELIALADDIRKELCKFSPADLRLDDDARESTLEHAESILNKLSAYV